MTLIARTIPSVGKKPKDYTYTIVSNLVSLSFPQLLVKLKMKFFKLKSGKSTGPFSISVD